MEQLTQEPIKTATQEEIITDCHAKAGTPLAAGAVVATEKQIIDALKTVQDPELALNIYELGLIYKIDIKSNGDVNIDMTLTSPTCPLAGEMPMMAATAVAALENVGCVDVALVWEPVWGLERISDELKLALGI